MKKLSAAHLKEKEERRSAVELAQTDLVAAIEAYNATMATEKAKVEAALEELNKAIADADAWRETVSSEQEDYVADRSDKWLEGDAGQAYEAWQDAWGQELEQVEIEFPPDLEEPGEDYAALIDDLPDEP